jgi:acetyltransferase-like isoleucine patch superfamily enzyme
MHKIIIIKSIKTAGKLLSFIYSYNIFILLNNLYIILYSGWLSRYFYSIGSSTHLKYGCTLVGGKKISVGNNCSIGYRAALTAWEGDEKKLLISIGNNVSIGDDCHITSINSIEIHDNVLMGKNITITDNSHGKSTLSELIKNPIDRKLFSAGKVIIEEGVWIGDKVTILPNTKVGRRSIVGANSVVTKDIPPFCIACGNPAIVKRIIYE